MRIGVVGAGLADLERRAVANGVPGLARLDRRGLAELEPHVRGVAALHSPRTAVVDFVAVARVLLSDVQAAGGRVALGSPVLGVRDASDAVRVRTAVDEHAFDAVVRCAGLGTEPLARAAGVGGGARILPFRGQYHRLVPERRHLVRGLVYPVSDPRYPFLGVHLTPRVDGEVLVGPNALLALAREGYRPWDVSARDLRDMLTWPGTAHLVRRHWRAGLTELPGAVSRRWFARAARRYVPALSADDLLPAQSGIRAQAVDRGGRLLDDFAVQVAGRVVLVRNAPSPAATSSLAIARHLVREFVGPTLQRR
ncbi:MAG: L-2-hydroxyglutarate oxidase [Nocardioidaceae bacterium]|nr:L-2-hydroxyglutarate oxidase [Nocardioidaceae bacterium]